MTTGESQVYTVSLVNRVGIRGNGAARRIAGNILRKLLRDFVHFVGPTNEWKRGILCWIDKNFDCDSFGELIRR